MWSDVEGPEIQYDPRNNTDDASQNTCEMCLRSRKEFTTNRHIGNKSFIAGRKRKEHKKVERRCWLIQDVI